MDRSNKPGSLVLESVVPIISRKQIIKEFNDGGTISLELGADGVYLRFDCECLDALPYCQAQCCAMKGTVVFDDEAVEKGLEKLVEADLQVNEYVMIRDSDGFCRCLNRDTRRCEIYDRRPLTCEKFHCTRGADARGWKLSNIIYRQCGI